MDAISEIRNREFQEAQAEATNSFDAYWAGSASASVMRDYAAGRVKTITASL